jgi:hypothetical protein
MHRFISRARMDRQDELSNASKFKRVTPRASGGKDGG